MTCVANQRAGCYREWASAKFRDYPNGRCGRRMDFGEPGGVRTRDHRIKRKVFLKTRRQPCISHIKKRVNALQEAVSSFERRVGNNLDFGIVFLSWILIVHVQPVSGIGRADRAAETAPKLRTCSSVLRVVSIASTSSIELHLLKICVRRWVSEKS